MRLAANSFFNLADEAFKAFNEFSGYSTHHGMSHSGNQSLCMEFKDKARRGQGRYRKIHHFDRTF